MWLSEMPGRLLKTDWLLSCKKIELKNTNIQNRSKNVIWKPIMTQTYIEKNSTNLTLHNQNIIFMYLSCLWWTAAVLKVPKRKQVQQHWCCTVQMTTDHAAQWGVQLLPPHLRSSHSPHFCTQATSGTGEFT